MKIGIVADTHNDIKNTLGALAILKEHGVEQVIHCGDITTPPIVELFAGIPTRFVVGNMDPVGTALAEAAENVGGPGSLAAYHELSWAGKQIAVTHGNDYARLSEYERCGLYDYVFHGHTHVRRDQQQGRTRIVNPGALGGRKPQSRSLCVLDLASGGLTFVELSG